MITWSLLLLNLINSLEIKMIKAIQWMKNNMIANPEKFKAIVLMKHDDHTAGSELNFVGEPFTQVLKQTFRVLSWIQN